ncbi:hypothetical protein B0H19DRAFT_1269270 [Mycena capillaripes]|nr:hypothetical protein B0H19DRAFT_1269270 [Mycena capillaripes]
MPPFRVSKLSALSFTLQRPAQLATDISPPTDIVPDTLPKLKTLCCRDPDIEDCARKLIRVVYANLDPERMPDPDTPTAEPTAHLRIFSALADAGPMPTVRKAVGTCLLQFAKSFGAGKSLKPLEALEAGLLRAIILCGAKHGSDDSISSTLNFLLQTLLIGGTLFYPFMIALGHILPEALVIEDTRGFRNSPSFEHWKFFASLTKERLGNYAKIPIEIHFYESLR